MWIKTSAVYDLKVGCFAHTLVYAPPGSLLGYSKFLSSVIPTYIDTNNTNLNENAENWKIAMIEEIQAFQDLEFSNIAERMKSYRL